MTTTTEKKYSTSWYDSNLGDRQAILNLIGSFTTLNPLTFHLRKDSKIGRIRVNFAVGFRRPKVLKDHMWRTSTTKFYVYPDQYDRSETLLRMVCKSLRKYATHRNEYCAIVQECLFDPIAKYMGTPKKHGVLYKRLIELTRTYPADYKLKYDPTPFDTNGDEYLSRYDHPVM